MRRRHPRGFTLIELSICVSILAIVVPAIYVWSRTLESDHAAALADLESARAFRTIREEVARDRWTRHWTEDAAPRLTGEGPCGIVSYVVRDGVLTRDDGCEPRALARNVVAIERRGETVRVTFEHRLHAGRVHQIILPRDEARR